MSVATIYTQLATTIFSEIVRSNGMTLDPVFFRAVFIHITGVSERNVLTFLSKLTISIL